MNRTPRRILALLPVAALALILTLLFSGGDNARAMLQASQVSPLATPTSSVSTPGLPTPGLPTPVLPTPVTGQPAPEVIPSLAPPTTVPLPTEVSATPTPLGFLPAPTIVNPNDLQSLPVAQPPVSGGGSSTEPTSIPTRAPEGDRTLRAAVELLNVLWLLCGGAVLVAGAVAIFLLWRRGQHT